MCGQQGGSLEAHHIRPKRRFPKLTLEVNNGITLCFDCHRRIVTGKEEHFVFIFDRIVDLNLRGI
jgi:5-methylcytosine-specific restriction endonuclease McrA